MTNKPLIIILPFLFISFPLFAHPKSIIEPCNASNSCTSLLSYRLPFDSKFSEIAFRFQANVSDLLASNSIDPSQTSWDDKIVPAKSLVKVPIPCPCQDGIRRSLSTRYTVGPADTTESISEGYGGLVSAEQIKIVNGISEESGLVSGEKIVIPLPCACFSNSNNGANAVYMSHVVEAGESLGKIAAEFDSTVNELVAINGLGIPQVDPGDILAIPLLACSSADLKWYNDSLIVPNGSFALTANNCIMCGCKHDDLRLQCWTSGIVNSCSHLQCKDSHLFIGDVQENKTAFGCNSTACVYRGYLGGKIFRSLVSSTNVQCLGNQGNGAGSPLASPPYNSFSSSPLPLPSPSPSPLPSRSSSSAAKTNDDVAKMNATHSRNKWSPHQNAADDDYSSKSSNLYRFLVFVCIASSFFL